ncbi:MAG: hypothetical protein ACPGJS_04285 [Flammeovirgaceae bacterium]
MMKKLVLYSIFIIISCLMACSSGKQDLQRGDYESSIKKSIDRLRSSPGNKKAQETLRQAYPLTVRYHTDRIDNLKASNTAFKWESILSSYNRLNRIYEDLQRCPSCLRLISDPQNFISEAEDARVKAAEERYQAGIMALAHRERQAAKKAYRHFQKVEKLQRNYKDTPLKLKEALHEATLKVVVERVPDPFNQTAVSSDYFNEKLFEYLRLNKHPNDFVRFYSAREAMDANLQKPDRYVMMTFQNFVMGQPEIRESTIDAVKDSVIIGQVDIDGEKRDVYGTVTAKITMYEKTLKVTGLLNMQVMNAYTNQPTLQEQFPSEYIWTNRWGNFNGDERALSGEQKEICNQREKTLPESKDLFIDFSQPIFNDVTRRLSSYFRRL